MQIFKKIRNFSLLDDAENEMIGHMVEEKVPERRLYQAVLYSLIEDMRETDRAIKRRLNCFKSWDWNGNGVPPNEVGTLYIRLQEMERLEREARLSPRIEELCDMIRLSHTLLVKKTSDIAAPYLIEIKKPYWQMVKSKRAALVMAGHYAQESA